MYIKCVCVCGCRPARHFIPLKWPGVCGIYTWTLYNFVPSFSISWCDEPDGFVFRSVGRPNGLIQSIGRHAPHAIRKCSLCKRTRCSLELEMRLFYCYVTWCCILIWPPKILDCQWTSLSDDSIQHQEQVTCGREIQSNLKLDRMVTSIYTLGGRPSFLTVVQYLDTFICCAAAEEESRVSTSCVCQKRQVRKHNTQHAALWWTVGCCCLSHADPSSHHGTFVYPALCAFTQRSILLQSFVRSFVLFCLLEQQTGRWWRGKKKKEQRTNNDALYSFVLGNFSSLNVSVGGLFKRKSFNVKNGLDSAGSTRRRVPPKQRNEWLPPVHWNPGSLPLCPSINRPFVTQQSQWRYVIDRFFFSSLTVT